MGTSKVYFQPPPNVKMEYPAIVYQRSNSNTHHADNRPYKVQKRYQVTVIDRDPDSSIPDKIALLPSCTHVAHFAKDGLNHDVYNLYF